MANFQRNVSLHCVMVVLVVIDFSIQDLRLRRIICNGTASQKQVYFEGDENRSNQCILYVKNIYKDVCQIRLDFEYFSLKQPRSVNNSAHVCLDDVFTIIVDPKIPSNVPVLCGENAGQHLYIPVRRMLNKNIIASFSVQLKYNSTEKSNKSNWKIKVTQLLCPNEKYTVDMNENMGLEYIPTFFTKQDVIAPSGCSQYFITSTGAFESFNFNDGKGPYVGNTKYSVCFKRPWNSCEILFKSVKFQLGYNNNAYNFTERDCDTKLGNYEYIDDYLYIPNGIMDSKLQASKYCNDVLSPNTTVVSRIPGPFGVFFSAGNTLCDVKNTQLGFRMKYFFTNQC